MLTLTTKTLATKLFSEEANIQDTKVMHQKPITIEYIAVRVLEVGRRPRSDVGPERWLIIERLKDGSFKHLVSNFDTVKSPEEIVHLAHQRYKI